MLQRNLIERPPVSDLFGVRGRRWLAERLERLPLDEQLTVQAGLRQIDFPDSEIAQLDKILGADALSDADALRLMTLPGVSLVTAIALLGAIGDIAPLPDAAPSRRLSRPGSARAPVRQRAGQARQISKQGPGDVRGLLVEAAWHAARSAGPLRAFHQRIAARRGSQHRDGRDRPQDGR